MNKQIGNDLCTEIISQAIDEMKAIQGDSFSLDKVNLAELERRTGISRARLRRLKQNNFQPMPHGNKGRKAHSPDRIYFRSGQLAEAKHYELFCLS